MLNMKSINADAEKTPRRKKKVQKDVTGNAKPRRGGRPQAGVTTPV